LGCFNELSQLIVTPGDYRLEVAYNDAGENVAKLVNNDPNIIPNWVTLLEEYGLEVDFTDLYIKTDNDIESDEGDIISSIEFTDDPSIVKLTVDVDTVPGTEPGVSPVIRNVNPTSKFPGDGILDPAAAGQLYLIVSDNTDGEEPAIDSVDPSGPWGVLKTYEGDIIQYNGINWSVVFDSTNQTEDTYVVNAFNMQHYKFTNGEWIFTYLGEFNPGYWRLFAAK